MTLKRLDSSNADDIKLLERFISDIPEGQSSFRYFVNRPIQVIQKHCVTYLLMNDKTPIAYGHIEPEDGFNWLGIAVSDEQTGKGVGTKMMKALIEFCKTESITPIHLTVDEDNTGAIHLYEKFDFTLEKQTETRLKYRLDL